MLKHSKIVNYQVCIWKFPLVNNPLIPNLFKNHGWFETKNSIEPLWISEDSYLFPPRLKEIVEYRTVLYESESDEVEDDI